MKIGIVSGKSPIPLVQFVIQSLLGQFADAELIIFDNVYMPVVRWVGELVGKVKVGNVENTACIIFINAKHLQNSFKHPCKYFVVKESMPLIDSWQEEIEFSDEKSLREVLVLTPPPPGKPNKKINYMQYGLFVPKFGEGS